MRKWLLIVLLLAIAGPAVAGFREDLRQALEQTKLVLNNRPSYEQYLQSAGQVTSALDAVIYSRTAVPANALVAVKFVNKQLRAFEEAWALRFRIGLKNSDSPDNVSFTRASLSRVSKAFAAIDPKLRVEEYFIGQGEIGKEEYRTIAYAQLLGASARIIIRNVDTAVARLR